MNKRSIKNSARFARTLTPLEWPPRPCSLPLATGLHGFPLAHRVLSSPRAMPHAQLQGQSPHANLHTPLSCCCYHAWPLPSHRFIVTARHPFTSSPPQCLLPGRGCFTPAPSWGNVFVLVRPAHPLARVENFITTLIL